jgi:hypothetical protein
MIRELRSLGYHVELLNSSGRKPGLNRGDDGERFDVVGDS